MYSLSSIRDHIIPKSLKCTHSATQSSRSRSSAAPALGCIWMAAGPAAEADKGFGFRALGLRISVSGLGLRVWG